MRWLGLLLVSCTTVEPMQGTPCHVVDWADHDVVVSYDPDGGAQPFEACSCGYAVGYATCQYNRGQDRLDGRCIGCAPRHCDLSSAAPSPHVFPAAESLDGTQYRGCSCTEKAHADDADPLGYLECRADGSLHCACPELCLRGFATVQQLSACRCEDGYPGLVRCSPLDAGASCDCSDARAALGAR